MANDTGSTEGSSRRGRKVLVGSGLCLGLLGPVLAATALFPSVASGEVQPVAHHDGNGGAQAELAQVRAATARFHRVEEAVAAGYELGWVNGAGNRIVAGCVSHPTAGAMGYHYFNAELMADNAVDALEPEVLVYAPAADGGLRLVAGPSRRPRRPEGGWGAPTPRSVVGPALIARRTPGRSRRNCRP